MVEYKFFGDLMEIEFTHALLATGGMFLTYMWGKYLAKREIIEEVIVKTIDSLADNHYVMVSENDDGEKILISIPHWIETLEIEKNKG